MNLKHRLLILPLVACFPLAPASRAGAVVGATEFTQIANNIELVASYAQHVAQTQAQIQMIGNQLKAYEVQLQNTKQLQGLDWNNAAQLLNGLGNTLQQTEQVAYMAAGQDEAYKTLHTNYQTYANGIPGAGDMAGKYRLWSQYNLDAANRASNAAGLALGDMGNEQARIAALKAAGANPAGQVQAIQAGTALTAELLDQMRELKTLIALQIDTQSRYQRVEEEKTQAAREKSTNVMHTEPHDPSTAKAYGEFK